MIKDMSIAVVIPSYNVKKHILSLIDDIGEEVDRIYVVDDKCPQKTGEFVDQNVRDGRVTVLFNEVNKGVGGAVKRGYEQGLSDGFDILIKLDGDGQMDPVLIPKFVRPIVERKADYTKGNRFYDFEFIKEMPKHRLFGNAVLSFFAKASSGYWGLFDPNNGYTAIHRSALKQMPLQKISDRYFFESDMLFRLNSLRAVVFDVPMKAVYKDEVSGLKVSRILWPFAVGHMKCFIKRIIYNYFIRDFSLASLEMLFGSFLLSFGVVYGGIHWVHSLMYEEPAATGVIMLAAITVILGVQMLLSAFNFDVQNVPKNPLVLLE